MQYSETGHQTADEGVYSRLPAATRTQYPFVGHFRRVAGFRYHYLDEGHGQPIVMVHGNPTWSFYYRNLVKSLSAKYRCIVPDHIGCGFSEKPDLQDYPYDFARRLSDFEEFINQMELDQFHLVVHDWGGMIGIAFATRHLEKIKSLTISNTAAFRLPANKRLPWSLKLCRSKTLGPMMINSFNAFCRGALKYCVKRRTLDQATRAGYLAPYGDPQDRTAVLRFVQDIPLQPEDPSYRDIVAVEQSLSKLNQIPKTIIWGREDFVFDDHFLGIWQQIFPAAPVHVLEGVGHYVLEDAFEDVLPLMERFLAKVEGDHG